MGSQRGYGERVKESGRSRVWSILKTDTPPRRPVPSNRRFFTIVTRKLCPIQSVQASHILLQLSEVLSKISSVPWVQISRSSTRYCTGKSKNCLEANGGSVRVQISLSRPFSFFMVKPRLCPRQDQSSPVQFPLSLKIVSQREAGLSGGFKETPYSLDREDSDERCHVLWLSITRRCNVEVTRRTVGCRADIPDREEEHEVTRAQVLTISPKVVDIKAMRFPLLEARSWQEAKSNLVTVALGRDGSWYGLKALGLDLTENANSRSWSKVCDSDRIVPSPSRSASGPWCWVGRSVMFLFDCWLAGWPFISNPWDENLKVEGVRGKTQTRSERGETDSENWAVVWTGQMGGNKSSLGKDFISTWEDEDREGLEESGQTLKRYEDACGDLEEHTQGTVVDRVKRLWRQVENVVKTSNYATKNSRMNSIKGGRM
ncbi:hypothetical protein YC2023_071958 [Brassica napus]